MGSVVFTHDEKRVFYIAERYRDEKVSFFADTVGNPELDSRKVSWRCFPLNYATYFMAILFRQCGHSNRRLQI
jgi:hypothetical protein